VQAIKNEMYSQYKMRNTRSKCIFYSFRQSCSTNFALWHIFHNWSVIVCVRSSYESHRCRNLFLMLEQIG